MHQRPVDRRTDVKCTVMKDVIVVRHLEFGRLQRQLSIAAERFNEATREKHASVVFIGNQLTITREDRTEFIEQIEAEQDAYDAIQELHDKMVRLLSEEPQARAAATIQR